MWVVRGGGLNAKIAKGAKRGLNAEGAEVMQRAQGEGDGGYAMSLVPSFDPEDEGGGGACGWVFRDSFGMKPFALRPPSPVGLEVGTGAGDREGGNPAAVLFGLC